jgi:hypothetical protein
MKTLLNTACCVFCLTHNALAANPTWTLHPKKTDELKQAGISVSYQILINDVQNPEYAFTISANAGDGIDALDAYFSIRNSKGLVAMNSWSDSKGKCVANFTVGKQSLKDAGFWVQQYRGERTTPFAVSGCYVLPLLEFANDESFCRGKIGVTAKTKTKPEFNITAPIQRDGPAVTIKVTQGSVVSDVYYDFHITVKGHKAQDFRVRNPPITKNDVRLVDLNADGFLDIMIAGGTDHLKNAWFKTLIYNDDKGEYRWITDKP